MPLDAAPAQSFGTTCLREIRKHQALRLLGSPPLAPLTETEIAAIIDAQLSAYFLDDPRFLPVTAKTKAGTNIPPTPEEVTA